MSRPTPYTLTQSTLLLFGMESVQQAARLCKVSADQFQAVRQHLREQGNIEDRLVTCAKPRLDGDRPQFVQPARDEVPPQAHFTWLTRQLRRSEQQLNERRRTVKFPVLWATDRAAEDLKQFDGFVGGPPDDTPRGRAELARQLNTIELVILAHEAACRRAVGLPVSRPLVHVSGRPLPGTGSASTQRTPTADDSPLLRPEEVMRPRAELGSVPDGDDITLLGNFDGTWRGQTYLIARGLCPPEVAPDLAAVEDGRIRHAVYLAGGFGEKKLLAVHETWRPLGVSYELWRG